MTTFHRDNAIKMARCRLCDHDLITRAVTRDRARVYCTNNDCAHSGKHHPTRGEPNRGIG